jgi:hypothetical protein
MELKGFLQAVFNGWVEIVGIILTILPFVEKIPRIKLWLQDKPFLERFSWLLWLIGGACMFWGFYSAWKEEHHQAIRAEQKLEELTQPKLVGTMNQWVAGTTPELNGMQVFVELSIKNTGAPSIAQSFRMRIKAGDYDDTENATYIPDGYKLFTGDNKLMAEFHESETWQKKSEIPITQGNKVGAWLRFVFKGITSDQFHNAKNRSREIYFKDVNEDKDYVVTDKTLDSGGINFYPGSGMPFKPRN